MNNAILTSNPENRKGNSALFIANQMRGDFKLPLLLILLHIPLGIILYNAGSLGLLHPLILFVIGMRHAILKDVKLERVAQIGAYLIGVEVLWRMAGTPIFW